MSRYGGDVFDALVRDDSLAALYERIRREEDEEELPIVELMKNGVSRETSGSRGRRVRQRHEKVSRNHGRDASGEYSGSFAGRPKNAVQRVKFQTTIAAETRDLLRKQEMHLSALLDELIHGLSDKEEV